MVAGEVGEEEEEDRKTGRRGGLGAGEQAKQKQKQRTESDRLLTPDFLRASQPLDANTSKHPPGLES